MADPPSSRGRREGAARRKEDAARAPASSSAGGIPRRVRIGGVDKTRLLAMLRDAGVRLNEAAERLIADRRFTTRARSAIVEPIRITVGALGFEQGALFDEIARRAASHGLALCPPELGPHLRLQHLDQAEGRVGADARRHRAPPGSLTIASAPLGEDADEPRGLYLRRIEGVPWLRGYFASPDHLWSPEDAFVFVRTGDTADAATREITRGRSAVPGPDGVRTREQHPESAPR